MSLDARLFGEGLALAEKRLVQLTWKSGRALIYALDTLAPSGEFRYEGEGWGLCFDGRTFVMSDGSDRLVRRDARTFAPLGEIAVRSAGAAVRRLNELECVGDVVYANVWLTDRILEISKLNGTVRSSIDASGLLSPEERAALRSEAILNGIAYDPSDGTFLLTGKLWPKLFEIKLK